MDVLIRLVISSAVALCAVENHVTFGAVLEIGQLTKVMGSYTVSYKFSRR